MESSLGQLTRHLPTGVVIMALMSQGGRFCHKLGMTEVTHHTLDWRFWYGGPWTATKLVSVRKPS